MLTSFYSALVAVCASFVSVSGLEKSIGAINANAVFEGLAGLAGAALLTCDKCWFALANGASSS